MRHDAPRFVRFLIRFIPSPRFFPLVTLSMLMLGFASMAFATLQPEARITQLRIENAGEIIFDYPYHWDATSPLLVAPGNIVELTMDVVKYDTNTAREVLSVGIPSEKFTVAIAYTNTSGKRSYIKVVNPILGLSWEDVEWRDGNWQKSLVWQVPEDFLGDGFILFSYQKYQGKVAIENIADVTIDNTEEPELESLVKVEDTAVPDVQVVAYQPEILAAADGEWVYLYGIRYWRPLHLPVGWRPYTHGRWYRGVYGITWQAYTPWEEYVDHYGTWYYHQRYGWIVQVGTVWRPHRVTFYYDSVKHYVAWRPFLSFGLSIQSRPYAPYRRCVELGLVDYWDDAPASAIAIDYVAVPSNKFALSISAGIGSLDISATIISAPARRNVILPPPAWRPRPVVVHSPPAPHHGAPPIIHHPRNPVPAPPRVAAPKNPGPRTMPDHFMPRGNPQPKGKIPPKPAQRLNPQPHLNPAPKKAAPAPKVNPAPRTAPAVQAPRNNRPSNIQRPNASAPKTAPAAQAPRNNSPSKAQRPNASAPKTSPANNRPTNVVRPKNGHSASNPSPVYAPNSNKPGNYVRHNNNPSTQQNPALRQQHATPDRHIMSASSSAGRKAGPSAQPGSRGPRK